MSGQQDELERYKTILDTLPDMVSLFDADLECIYVNQTLADESGTPRDEYLGASIDTVLGYLADEEAQEWIETME